MALPVNSRRRPANGPVPLRALRDRLHAADGFSEWASFLPAELRKAMGCPGVHSIVGNTDEGVASQGPRPKIVGADLVGMSPAGHCGIIGKVWTMSQDRNGCRKVQDA